MRNENTKNIYGYAENVVISWAPIDADRFFTDFSYAIESRLVFLSGHYTSDRDVFKRGEILDDLFLKRQNYGFGDSSLLLLIMALEFSVYNVLYSKFQSRIEEIEARFKQSLRESPNGIIGESLTLNTLLVYALRLHWGFHVGRDFGNENENVANGLKKAVYSAFYDAESGLFREKAKGKPDIAASVFALFSDCAFEAKESLIERLTAAADRIGLSSKYFLYFGLHFSFGQAAGDMRFKAFILGDLEKSIRKNGGGDPALASLIILFGNFYSDELFPERFGKRTIRSSAPEDSAFDIIIQAGQSNAEGSGKGNDARYAFFPNENIYYLTGDLPETVFVSPHGYRQQLTGAGGNSHIVIAPAEAEAGGDFALAFARKYMEDGHLRQGRKVLIVRAAVGGTGFLDGNWKIGDRLQRRMTLFTETALTLNRSNRLVAFLWHQGENDIICGSDEQTYFGHFSSLINDLRNWFRVPALPFAAGDFVPDWKEHRVNEEQWLPVVCALRDAAGRLGGCFVGTEGLPSNDQVLRNGDSIHFSKGALYDLGARYYQAFRELLPYSAGAQGEV
jgi:hypothetical protein